eukprot:3806477-Pleurochrysis_carterae.AAC.1
MTSLLRQRHARKERDSAATCLAKTLWNDGWNCILWVGGEQRLELLRVTGLTYVIALFEQLLARNLDHLSPDQADSLVKTAHAIRAKRAHAYTALTGRNCRHIPLSFA